MLKYSRRHRFLAIALATLAGYMDAIGFLKLGGLFVSFMSGNSTRLAVGLADGNAVAITAASLIAAFVIGVVSGSLLAAASGSARKPVVLSLVAIFLTLAAALDSVQQPFWTPLALAAGMGAANCVFMRDGEVSVGVTYMTGALVKFGQHLAGALLGRDRVGWLPFLILWAGLVLGAVLGAALYPRIGTAGLWGAAAFATCLALYSSRLGPAQTS